jgi:hypothetical protein
MGIDSRMLVRHKHSDDEHVIVHTGKHDPLTRAGRTFLRAVISRREKGSRVRGRGVLTDPRADLLRTCVPEIDEADVINIHKTEHFADTPAFLDYLYFNEPLVDVVINEVNVRPLRLSSTCPEAALLSSKWTHRNRVRVLYATPVRRQFWRDA